MFSQGHQTFAFGIKFQWASKGLWPWFNDWWITLRTVSFIFSIAYSIRICILSMITHLTNLQAILLTIKFKSFFFFLSLFGCEHYISSYLRSMKKKNVLEITWHQFQYTYIFFLWVIIITMIIISPPFLQYLFKDTQIAEKASLLCCNRIRQK